MSKRAGEAATQGERRAYQRGYYACTKRGYEHARRLIDLFKRYRERLQIGADDRRCDSCARWKRGGARCVWGKCAAAQFEWSVEPRMWADHDGVDNKRNLYICTTEDFSCPNWLPDAGLRP